MDLVDISGNLELYLCRPAGSVEQSQWTVSLSDHVPSRQAATSGLDRFCLLLDGRPKEHPCVLLFVGVFLELIMLQPLRGKDERCRRKMEKCFTFM